MNEMVRCNTVSSWPRPVPKRKSPFCKLKRDWQRDDQQRPAPACSRRDQKCHRAREVNQGCAEKWVNVLGIGKRTGDIPEQAQRPEDHGNNARNNREQSSGRSCCVTHGLRVAPFAFTPSIKPEFPSPVKVFDSGPPPFYFPARGPARRSGGQPCPPAVAPTACARCGQGCPRLLRLCPPSLRIRKRR